MSERQVTPDVPEQASIDVTIDTSLYAEDVVMRATHRFTDSCYVHLERGGGTSLVCTLRIKSSTASLSTLAAEFENELLDQALRARLRVETEPVRRLILAQAFSKVNLLHPELDIADPADDPQGIARPDPDPRKSSPKNVQP